MYLSLPVVRPDSLAVGIQVMQVLARDPDPDENQISTHIHVHRRHRQGLAETVSEAEVNQH